jgi:repressor of nif and glnA expression
MLAKVERTILAILNSYSDPEISGRVLRGLLSNRGFRRSAPAFYFTMMNLEHKGLVTCREEVRVVDGVEIRDRYYQLVAGVV